MNATVIQVEKLGKRYQIGQRRGRQNLREGLSEAITGAARRLPFANRASSPGRTTHSEHIWALQDVSFTVQKGEALGIIGRNGAGKSTLLKILSRITRPTTGHARIRGRVGSLLEVGTGFHPELTGRENTFLSGAVLGMKRHEITAKFDEIVAFAEIERFLDTPVKYYSSGMYMRLAFSVAAHLEPEILIVDEVLAVGDASFQKKCLGRMSHSASAGRTVLFVSHDLGAIQTLCQRALLLEQGKIIDSGPARQVVINYLSMADSLTQMDIATRTDRRGQGDFQFQSLDILDAYNSPRDFVVTGEEVRFRLRITTPERRTILPAPLDISILIRDHRGNLITTLSTFFTGDSPHRLPEIEEIICTVPHFPLLDGQYRIDLWCATSETTQDWLEDCASLRVEPGNYFGDTADLRLPKSEYHGAFLMPQIWHSPHDAREREK